MAYQRWSECGRHRARRSARRRRLGLARSLTLLVALATAACDSPEPTAPEIVATPDFPSGSTGGGGSGTSPDDVTLPGEWERFDVFQTDVDVVTTTTRWRFAADGTCRRTITTFSLVEGFPRSSARDCTWTTGVLDITITFLGAESATFDLAFAGFDPNRLILDGFEYRRVG